MNLARRNSWLLVVACQVGGFVGNFVENIIDEGVHDGHGLGGNTSIWVNLFQHLVDINLVRLRLHQEQENTIIRRTWSYQRTDMTIQVYNM